MKKSFTCLLLLLLAATLCVQGQQNDPDPSGQLQSGRLTETGHPLQSPVSDKSPGTPIKKPDNPDEQWDVEYTFSAQAASCQAVVSDGYHFYLTYWNGNGQFDKFDYDGTFIESFTIAEAPAIRDFAYDGEYFYGAPNGGMTIAQLDLENQMVVSTIPISTSAGVTGARHLAYDPDLDYGNGGFWLGQWNDLAAVDMSGNTIYSSSQTQAAASCYGSAYDPYTDPGSPKLWLFTQNSGASPYDLVMLEEFDINTRSFTGFTLDLYTMIDEIPGYIPGTSSNETIAGGACAFMDNYLRFMLVLNIQQSPNLVVGLELARAWPSDDVCVYSIVEPVSGVSLGNAEPVTIHIWNIGFLSQTEIPWEVSWSGPTGTGIISGTWTGSLGIDESVYVTLPETVDMSVFGEYTFEACTMLADDSHPENDCKTKTIIGIVDETWYAYLAEDNSGTLVEGPVEFNPSTPGGIVQLAPTTSDEIIAGACWVGDYWWGCQQGGGLYYIDDEYGYMTFVGDGPDLNGLAHSGGYLFYGVSGTELFEIDPLTGQGTLIGAMGNSGGEMMGLACDENGDLYGFDTGDDMFYSIDKTTATATAIGPLGFDYEGPQDMAFNKATGQCYIAGFTTSGGLYSVDVETGAASLLGEFPEGVRLTGFAIPGGSAPPVGDPPSNFIAEFVEDVGVECSWGGMTPQYWLGYDDGVNAGGMGSTGGVFYTAIRWDAIDLIPFNGYTITDFQFFPLKFANNSDITFKIWKDTNASFLVYEQVLENLNWNEWNTISLDEPQTIDATKDLWVGFEVVAPSGEDPIGCDDGPAIAGYGDMISLDGATWESLSINYGLDFNYNLKILVEEDPDSKNNISSGNPKLEFLGVNIYRNGDQVNSNIIEPGVTDYLDPFVEPGTWIYTARSVYDEGLSDPTLGVEVVIPGTPEIAVSPESLSEIHDDPPQITTQELTITNNGVLPLEWGIVFDFDAKDSRLRVSGNEANTLLIGDGFTMDVGVWSIIEPASGVFFGDEEPVTITIRNYGDETQTEIPWEVNWSGPTGSGTFSGTWTGNLSAGEEVDFTLIETLDMSVPGGDYEIEACTQLPGDENPENDCKIKLLTGPIMEYCDASTTTEDEWIANVLCGDINNSSGWQGGVADYTDISTYIQVGASEAITITNGNAWAADVVTIWVDWNMDYEFGVGTNEEFFTENVGGTGETFIGEIAVPAGTPNGDYRMRIRMTYNSTPEPCGNASYGEVEDYTISIGTIPSIDWISVDLTNGVIEPGDSQVVAVSFNSEDLNAGLYQADIMIESNDTVNPVVEVPVSLEVIGTTNSLLFYETFEEYEAGEPLVQQAIAQGKDYWTTMNNQPGGAEDPLVTYDAVVGITGLMAEEGNEPVLDFGENYTEGLYNFEFSFLQDWSYSNGIVNILQKFDAENSISGLQIHFDTWNHATIHAGGENATEIILGYNYYGHRLRGEIDLDNDLARLFYNDAFIYEWQWSLGAFGNGNLNQLAAMHFSGNVSGNGQIYYDQIIMVEGEWPGFFPPQNFQFDYSPGCSGWFFTWDEPGSFSPQWLTYSNEEINNSIGTNSEVSFDVAARWEPDELAGFYNGVVSKINFVPGEPDDICTYSLRIWQGGDNNPVLIYNEELSNVLADEWNEVELASPVPIDPTEELWIGFNCNTASGYPAGCDDGPQTEGYGNMMFWEGEWVTLTSLNQALTYNWAIQGYIESGQDGFKSINELKTPISQFKNEGTPVRNPEPFDIPTISDNKNKNASFTGYNLYFRDIELGTPWELSAENIQETEYCFGWPPIDYWYMWYATAVYEWNNQLIESGRSTIYEEAESIEEISDDIDIWPNPVNENLTIESISRIIKVEIFNISGLRVYAEKPSKNTFQINTSQFKPGIYTLHMQTEKGIVVRKVVVK